MSITCNGARFDVGINLMTALWRLRRPTVSRMIWVDAICINQKDLDEREVRSKAKIVLIWLGVAGSGSNVAMEMCNRLEGASRWNSIKRERIGELEYKATETLLARPWFSRVWMIQELTLAANPIVLCGSYSLPWAWLSNACPSHTTSMSVLKGCYTGITELDLIYEHVQFQSKRESGGHICTEEYCHSTGLRLLTPLQQF